MPDSKTLEELESELNAALESDDEELASELLDKVENFESEQADEPAAEEAEVVTLTPPAPEAEEAPADFATQVKGAIASSGGFDNILVQLSPEDINTLVVEMDGEDDRLALVLPGVTDLGLDRVHLEVVDDVRRAARGLALAAAGGVDLEEELITSNSGRQYTIEDGICYNLRSTEQPDLGGNITKIVDPVPCKGHLAYKRIDGKFVATGEKLLRCTHQWAAMFQLGNWVTVSKNSYLKTVITEIAQRVGDESARKNAADQIEEWRTKSAATQEVRAEQAMSINHMRNTNQVDPQTGLIPSMPEILNQTLPSGETLQAAIAALNGSLFLVTFNMPMNGRSVESRVRARNAQDFLVKVAPSMVTAKRHQGQLELLDVKSV